MRRGQRFEFARRLSFSYFSMMLHKEIDLGELNAELVGVGGRRCSPYASLYDCTPIRLERAAEGESNPIDECGEHVRVGLAVPLE